MKKMMKIIEKYINFVNNKNISLKEEMRRCGDNWS